MLLNALCCITIYSFVEVEELKSKKVLLGGIVELSLSSITGDVGYIRFEIGKQLKLVEAIDFLLKMEHYESFNGYEIWIEKK